jgi:hypothetical protein
MVCVENDTKIKEAIHYLKGPVHINALEDL